MNRQSKRPRSSGDDEARDAAIVTDALDELWAAAPELDQEAVWAVVSPALAARPGRLTRTWWSLLGLPARAPRIASAAAAAVLLASSIGLSVLLLAPRGADVYLRGPEEGCAPAS